jgi:regulatory protein
MPTVTAITRKESRSKARTATGVGKVVIEVDGEAFVTCRETVVSEFLLYDGKVLDSATLEELHERVLASEAMADCAVAVSHRPMTERELADKLRARGHGDTVVEEALERARHLALVDDAAYAREFVASRLRRGMGDRRIQADLAKRGVAREVIQFALDEAADAEGAEEGISRDEAATIALARKFRAGTLDDDKARAKAQRFLLTRGFSYAQADTAIRAHTGAE